MRQKKRRQAIAILIAMIVGQFALNAGAQDSTSSRSDARLQYMRDLVKAIEVISTNRESGTPDRFGPDPILRFGDATRQTADGALWKLGGGRPQAIIAMEFTRGFEEQPSLNYEFLCLANPTFEIHAGKGWRWTPRDSALKFERLNGVLPPSRSANIRMRQMKQLALRFSATEQLDGEEFHLRLMPQPIDRYVVDERKGESGAIFVFANGTNPEVLLLLESVENGWQYGLARMCGAAPTVKFDEQVVWAKPSMDKIVKSWSLDYTGETHAIELPADSDQSRR